MTEVLRPGPGSQPAADGASRAGALASARAARQEPPRGEAPMDGEWLKDAPMRTRRVLQILRRAPHGRLRVIFPNGRTLHFGHAAIEQGPESAEMRLANWNLVDAALDRGDIGVAQTWIDGDWTSPDPARALRFFIENRNAVEKLIYGSVLGRLAYRLRHLARRNSRQGARRNIERHYDLGNTFYALWLDASMTYSSALFSAPGPAAEDERADRAPPPAADGAELASAQGAKYRRVLDRLALPPGASILEIGCGWGGFAEFAGSAGHAVTGLTLSPAQFEYATDRLERQGLQCGLALRDYRDEHGTYDGIASIEMFEAVGLAYWPQYFQALARCLKPDGRACIQVITIEEEAFERYQSGTDFIQQYVFPGGMLPSPSAFERGASAAGLCVIDRFAFGRDYARTLASWRARFTAQLAAVQALGFDERFVRLWTFYLAYCEAAFTAGRTNVMQFTLAHRRDRSQWP